MQEAEIGFVLALGQALHRYGTPAHRVEQSLDRVCRQLGLSAEVFSTPTALIMSFGAPADLKTRMMRVEGGELDMGKLAQVDTLADRVLDHTVTIAEGTRQLDKIINGPSRFGRGLSTFVHGVTAGSLAVFFGGSLLDVALAGMIGLTLGLLAQLLKRSTDQTRVFELVGSAFTAFTADVFSTQYAVSPSLVTLAALVILLPGMSLTVAMTELATRNLIAGTARLMSAVIVLLELVVGVALGERLAHAVALVHHETAMPLPEYANWIALAAASIAVAILVQAQVRAFGWIMGGCLVAYVGSRLGTSVLDSQLGVLIAARNSKHGDGR